ncbi:hypothetical protein [Nocardioides pacificus]
MRHPDDFDAFYTDARERLLLQTYSLTGDLPASRAAVRDAFIGAWHHWRKVSRLDDPEAWVRPQAWAHAQRRHTTRLLHRDKSLDDDGRATLEALGKLSQQHRRILLLNQLVGLTHEEVGREVGVRPEVAERDLRAAQIKVADRRGILASEVPTLFVPLQRVVDDVTWPRASVIRRTGTARRRTHTLVGIAVATVALIASGAVVVQGNGVRPSLAEERLTGSDAPSAGVAESAPMIDAERLLTAEQVARVDPSRTWRQPRTDDNTSGNGLVLPCQQQRFADPEGAAALFRRFPSQAPAKEPRTKVTQVAELSDDERSARNAFRTTVGWFGGCLDERVQVLATYDVPSVGDEASMLVVRAWGPPTSTITVGVARTGRLTTSVVEQVGGDRAPDLASMSSLLAASVNAMCGADGTATCAAPPRPAAVPPVPVGQAPGMLAQVDLPPLPGIDQSWVGTDPARATDNVAATRCDETDFSKAPVRRGTTRDFLVPEARLADEFGLTETMGVLPSAEAARGFADQVRRKMSTCDDKDLGTDVSQIFQQLGKDRDTTVWRVATEVSDNRTVEFLMAIVRNQDAVAQIGFVPSGKVTLAAKDFTALAQRAGERLAELGRPGND